MSCYLKRVGLVNLVSKKTYAKTDTILVVEKEVMLDTSDTWEDNGNVL